MDYINNIKLDTPFRQATVIGLQGPGVKMLKNWQGIGSGQLKTEQNDCNYGFVISCVN